MVRTIPLSWMCVATVFLWGCKDKPKVAEKTEIKQVVAADYLAALPVGGNLAEQLQLEAAARPKGAITAEAVIEALGKAQIPLSNNKQFIGRAVLATYCFGGITAAATSVTVCEYPSADAAKAGLEQSQTQFAALPNRTLTQNKRTVLTLMRGVDSPATKAEAAKAVEVFSKL